MIRRGRTKGITGQKDVGIALLSAGATLATHVLRQKTKTKKNPMQICDMQFFFFFFKGE